MESEVIVLGSGIIGLTSAVVLAEGGRRVTVWAREPAEETTSAVAGGLWWPYRIEPEHRVADWSVRSFEVYAEQAERAAVTGVRMRTGLQLGADVDGLGPWRRALPEVRPAEPAELPGEYTAGVRATVPIVDTATHLAHLRDRLAAAGGEIERRAAGSLAEAGRSAPYVVNCTGLGARELVPDESVRPVQGQLVVVANPGVTEWVVSAYKDATATLYALPQPYGLVLGGTAVEDAWGTDPDPAAAAGIVARCARIVPEVADAEVLAHRVGLRPARPAVRLEAELLPGGARCVHNYGHGGAGVTVAWGCAEEAAELLEAA
ncbi:FAD-dependent oxidoreductase [Streptomyces sp. MAR4 CNX-425]|uniref:FAD-dependent oxidoreductase n=1 Tax=Streptomyces sp. MAR4 CNX-425 TaxID=3406343 RepID=UPI003B505482